MTKHTILVAQYIEVTVDESKFTPEFIANFNQHFHHCPTVEDHMKHIATSFARGIVTSPSQFLEGYGLLNEYGVKLKRQHSDAELVED